MAGFLHAQQAESTADAPSQPQYKHDAAWAGTTAGDLAFDPTELEQAHADMLFSVAGSQQGLTAAQLVARTGVPVEWVTQALLRAQPARLAVLEAMPQNLVKVRALLLHAAVHRPHGLGL